MNTLQRKMELAVQELEIQAGILHERELDTLNEEKQYFLAEIEKCEKQIHHQKEVFKEEERSAEL